LASGPPPSHFVICPFGDDVVLRKLKLADSDQTLNDYLLGNCPSDHANHFARTYVYVDSRQSSPREAVGFITLIACHVTNQHVRPFVNGSGLDEYQFHYPAIKIARLAVCEDFQRMNLGRSLVEFTIALSLEIYEMVGCRIVAVDANKPAIKFYEKAGFVVLESPKNREKDNPFMYLDLHQHINKEQLDAAINST
jgi:ribosomal protein S18 acetylase RimI-like enzyme